MGARGLTEASAARLSMPVRMCLWHRTGESTQEVRTRSAAGWYQGPRRMARAKDVAGVMDRGKLG